MHITLTGNLGSGKSTICKILESSYGYEVYSTGKVQRALAEEMGISVLEMNEKMRSDPKYDHLIDDATARISRENPDAAIVFDSRLAWNFVECSLKVFLSVSLDVAAERVFHDNRGNVEKYSSLEDAKKQLAKRAATEDVRYREIYGLNYFDFHNYNLILDSTYCSPELLARQIMEEVKIYEKAQNAGVKFLLSPKRLGIQADSQDFSHLPFAKSSENTNAFSASDSKGIATAFNPKDMPGMASDLKGIATASYPEGIVTIREVDGAFEILSGKEIVKAAAAAGMPFVHAKLG